MPLIRLSTVEFTPPIPVETAAGNVQHLPRLQFRCWARLPGILTTRDAVVDTGSPFTWIPQEIWQHFRPGADFEWLPYPAGFVPPQGKTAGWNFRFRFARMLVPIALHDPVTELERHGVIVQLTDGSPPVPARTNRPAHLLVGLWGGLLDNTRIAVTPNPRTGLVDGVLEF